MRLFSLIFNVNIVRLFKDHQLHTLNSEQNGSIVPSSILANRIIERNKVRVDKLTNIYKNRGFDKCYFCMGTGYVDCPKCDDNNYCIQCGYSGFTKCHICGGSGKGGPKLTFIPVPQTYNLVEKTLLESNNISF